MLTKGLRRECMNDNNDKIVLSSAYHSHLSSDTSLFHTENTACGAHNLCERGAGEFHAIFTSGARDWRTLVVIC